MIDGAALSALNWWAEAGVDTLVDDLPRDWLAPLPAATATPAAPAAPPPPQAASLPADLDAFRRWLLADAGVPGMPAARIDAAGDPSAGTIVVIDMPEPGDRAAGTLLSGEAGALFDRMMTAIDLTRDGLYLIPFAPARPVSGRVGEEEARTLTTLLRHHLLLARPRRLLLMGDAPVRALTGRPLPQARGEALAIALDDTTLPAVATFHPRFVQARPDVRQQAWADLQRLAAL